MVRLGVLGAPVQLLGAMLWLLLLPRGTAWPQVTVVVTETASPTTPTTDAAMVTTTVWGTDAAPTTTLTGSPTEIATETILTPTEPGPATTSPETMTATWPTATLETTAMTAPAMTETTSPEVASPIIPVPPIVTVPTQVPGGCVSGEFRCDSENPTLFYKCNFNQWIRFECAPGTFCQPFGQFILCGFGQFSSVGTATAT